MSINTDSNQRPASGIAIKSSYFPKPQYRKEPLSMLRAWDLETGDSILMGQYRKLYGQSSTNVSEYILLLLAVIYRIEHAPSALVYSDSTTAVSWFYESSNKSKVPISPKLKKLMNDLDAQVDWTRRTGVELWNTENWGKIRES
jgi:hypothetical protein